MTRDRMQRAEDARAKLLQTIAAQHERIRALERERAGRPDAAPTPIPDGIRRAFEDEEDA